MITIETGCTSVLPCQIEYITSMTYDGYEYILLRQQRLHVTVLNEELCPVGNQRTYQCYSNLSYHIQEGCYYATTQEHSSVMYKLNLNFEEIGCKDIPCDYESPIYAISAHPEKPEVLLLYANELKCFDTLRDTIIKQECIDEAKQVMDVIALSDGYLLAYQCDGSAYIEVHCSSCASNCFYNIPCNHQLLAMTLIGICGNEDEDCIIYDVQLILMNIDTQEQVSTLLQITCEKEIAVCPHPCDQTCECGRNEIIHSIALEEAGIAHILNAEGEKIQKAVASDISIEELLRVNDSVSRAITKITLLEGQLYIKLDSLHCLCVEEKNKAKK